MFLRKLFSKNVTKQPNPQADETQHPMIEIPDTHEKNRNDRITPVEELIEASDISYATLVSTLAKNQKCAATQKPPQESLLSAFRYRF